MSAIPRGSVVAMILAMSLVSSPVRSAGGSSSVTAAPSCASSDDTRPTGLVVVIEYKTRAQFTADLRALKNASIRGAALQIHWSDVEPSSDSFDWSALDELFAASSADSKWVQLLIFPGFFSPRWALEGVKTGSFPLQYGPGAGTAAALPMPWDRTYLGRWTTFLRRLSDRYASNPALRVMAADGPTSVSAETTLPNSPPDLRKWQTNGYTPTKYLGAWRDVLDAYAADFPNQCVSISGGASAGLNINDHGRLEPQQNIRTKKAIVDEATRRFGPRFALQLSDVHAGPGPHVESSEGEDHYIIDQIGHVITGFQLRTSAEHGSAVMGAQGNPPLALKKSLDLALATNSAGRHVDYVEVYSPDVFAADLQPALQAAAARFAHK
jgi:Beta-galactosidase